MKNNTLNKIIKEEIQNEVFNHNGANFDLNSAISILNDVKEELEEYSYRNPKSEFEIKSALRGIDKAITVIQGNI